MDCSMAALRPIPTGGIRTYPPAKWPPSAEKRFAIDPAFAVIVKKNKKKVGIFQFHETMLICFATTRRIQRHVLSAQPYKTRGNK